MDIRYTDLVPLGWNAWFEERAALGTEETLARVAAVDRGSMLVMDHGGTYRAKLSGSYIHLNAQTQERPCVGDWVCLEKQAADGHGLIHRMLERRTFLLRKAAGDSGDHQMIAANVDTVMIVQSCHFDFNLKRLERYLVMVQEGGAEPCILLTKTDLVEPELLASQLEEIRAAGITAPVLTLSKDSAEGFDELVRSLIPARTYCLVGSSGVGKSTLINRLLGLERLRTKVVSETGEGRHTTVRRELIPLVGGALVIDNPGMREFGILGAERGIEDRFADIVELGTGCRYRNCSHAGESGCAVVEALNSGALSRDQYDHFLKLRLEAGFNQLTHGEKRKKDRDFGRFIKSAKKDLLK
jgi:ribosome biogenesis GTPase